jgi:hypothetical protein
MLFQPQRLIDDSPLHRAQYLCSDLMRIEPLFFQKNQ